jgi:ribosomal protein S18 acetylase RimI-like enzyme
MQIRLCNESDLPRVTDLVIEVFGPFYEQSFRSMVPPDVFEHQHGSWADDYRDLVPTLLDPAAQKYLAVAGSAGGEFDGCVAWEVNTPRRHGHIRLVGVREPAREQGVGRALCEYALSDLRARGVEVVEVGTGGDGFHAPARALYESLGFHPIPIMGYLRAV